MYPENATFFRVRFERHFPLMAVWTPEASSPFNDETVAVLTIVHPRITEALARPTIGHLDPEFIRMMDELKTLLQYAFQTGNRLTLPVSAPDSAGIEACFTNLVKEGDKVIVCINGVFGGRMQQKVERLGGTSILVERPGDGQWTTKP